MLEVLDANKIAMSAIELLKISMKYQLSTDIIDLLTQIYNSQKMKGGSSCMSLKKMSGGSSDSAKKIMELQGKKGELEKELSDVSRAKEREVIMKKIMGIDGLINKIMMKGGSCGKKHGMKKVQKGGQMMELRVLEESAISLLKLAMAYELSSKVLSEVEKLLKKNGYKKVE